VRVGSVQRSEVAGETAKIIFAQHFRGKIWPREIWLSSGAGRGNIVPNLFLTSGTLLD
jgi:hypothetical protein